MIQIITPPHPIEIPQGHKSIFLAGSIEMGIAIDWQNQLIEAVKDCQGVLLNPRRTDWDASWEQTIDNPAFKEQVNWELAGLEIADLIVYYFAPQTKSPITLLELGLYARLGKIVVCCPDGFWRKGNIDVVCERYGVKQVEKLEDLVHKVSFFLQNS
jgi:hypothetical protein